MLAGIPLFPFHCSRVTRRDPSLSLEDDAIIVVVVSIDGTARGSKAFFRAFLFYVILRIIHLFCFPFFQPDKEKFYVFF